MGYEFSFGTSHAKVGRLRAENSCCKQTHIHFANLYIDVFGLIM